MSSIKKILLWTRIEAWKTTYYFCKFPLFFVQCKHRRVTLLIAYCMSEMIHANYRGMEFSGKYIQWNYNISLRKDTNRLRCMVKYAPKTVLTNEIKKNRFSNIQCSKRCNFSPFHFDESRKFWVTTWNNSWPLGNTIYSLFVGVYI